MNYTQPTINSNPLLIAQADLTGQNFGALVSNPLTILAGVPDFFIIPVFFLIQYKFGTLQPTGIFIIDSNLRSIGFVGGAKLYNFNASDYSGSEGYIQTPCANYSQQNLVVSQDNTTVGGGLVLSADLNAANSVPNLQIRIGYYLQPDF